MPNLVGGQDPIPCLPDDHAESDTFDRVNQREQKATLAASALLWDFSDSATRLKRQSRAEIEKLITGAKLDEQMKAFNQWDDFKTGKRGISRQPGHSQSVA